MEPATPSDTGSVGQTVAAMDTSGCSDVEFASSDEEAEEIVQPKKRHVFHFAAAFTTLRAAKASIDTYDTSVYKFAYNYGKKGHGERVYKCVSHNGCKKRLRLTNGGEAGYKIEHAGTHNGEATNSKKRGIHGAFKQEVADILLGCGPKKCSKILHNRYADVPELVSLLPDHVQLKNHKTHLKSTLAGGWEIKNVAKLLEWAFPRMCSTRVEFFVGTDSHVNNGDFELIVLECFEHGITTDEGKVSTCFGLVVTSRYMFRNVLYAYNGQERDGIIGVTDGTYRIHFGGWMLVDFGTYVAHYNRDQYSKTFIPWVYMFVRTEHQAAYQTMFASVRNLDRTPAIANAYLEVWPKITLLNCYPHFSRKSRENRGRLVKSDFYETNVKVNILYLVEARSKNQFGAMAKLFLRYWRSQGESVYADWLEQYYLGNLWGNWFYKAAIPGVTPTQNALESHHKVIKETCIDSLRASTAVVLNDALPRILKHQEEQPVKLQLLHFCEGPLIGTEVELAQKLLLKRSNHYSVKDPNTKVLTGILFNTEKFMVTSTNIHGTPIIRQRAQRYLNSLKGKLPRDATVFNTQLYYLSLYHVQLKHLEKLNGLVATPKFKATQIEAIRDKYLCDCRIFAHNGWQCSHVIAAMVLQGDLKISGILETLPVRKHSGGQRKQKGPLDKSHADSHLFSVDALTEDFLRHPLYPVNWTVMKEFPVSKNDIYGPTHFLQGKVTSWGEHHGRYYWMLKFSDLSRLQVDCNTLAELVHDAYIHGADIKGPIFFELEPLTGQEATV
ncbi:hypothetical protein DVH05_002762 [Phytophthora capsici]|nr:hypothetical protein DVH05_002762 [Phytophthora capsici]